MKQEGTCCPKFDPAPWQEKEVTWRDKLFVKDSVKAFMHIPLNMGAVMTKMGKLIDETGAKLDNNDYLILSDELSPWKSDQLIAVTKEVPGLESVRLSGTYLTKVFEGPYQEAPNWYREMQNFVKGKGKEAKKIYMFYTTCPKCAKKYGHNYVVLLAQIR
ncbi:MAG: hydrolase [Patescibacteria group bacterium]|jgi:hypothetical protein